MPAIPVVRNVAPPQLDSLAPRHVAAAPILARQPAIDFPADSPIALNALAESAIDKRQIQPGIIPTYYNTSGPTAGTVVGIVLGSVAGWLLLIWLFYSLANINGSGNANIAGEEEIVVRRRRNSHSNRSRRSTRTEVREYSRSPRRSRPEQIIVEERRQGPRTTRTRSIVVEERARVPGDDIVEVIEEHDDYHSRRGSRRY